MKKYIGICIMLALVFGASVTRAEESNTQQRERPLLGAEQKNEVEDRTAPQKDTAENIRARFEERRTTLFKDIAVKRVAFAMAQINNIEKRMESRAAKLKAAGVDTSAADAKVTAVQAAIADAKTKVDAFKQATLAKIEGTASPANTTELSALKKAAEQSIKAARVAMTDLLKTLKTYKMPEAAKTDVEQKSGDSDKETN